MLDLDTDFSSETSLWIESERRETKAKGVKRKQKKRNESRRS
jgi:hypothetical protein